jgi:hypothetical protein
MLVKSLFGVKGSLFLTKLMNSLKKIETNNKLFMLVVFKLQLSRIELNLNQICIIHADRIILEKKVLPPFIR